jgi:hypothetical protein
MVSYAPYVSVAERFSVHDTERELLAWLIEYCDFKSGFVPTRFITQQYMKGYDKDYHKIGDIHHYFSNESVTFCQYVLVSSTYIGAGIFEKYSEMVFDIQFKDQELEVLFQLTGLMEQYEWDWAA